MFQIEDYHMNYSFQGRYSSDTKKKDMLLIEFTYKAKDGTGRWGKFLVPNNLQKQDLNEIIKSQVDAEMKRYI